MRHWYILLKHDWQQTAAPRTGCPTGFHSGGAGLNLERLPSGLQWRTFWLGFVEVLPLSGAVGFGSAIEAVIPYTACVLSGAGLTVALCWLLRDLTPPTIIHSNRQPVDPPKEPTS